MPKKRLIIMNSDYQINKVTVLGATMSSAEHIAIQQWRLNNPDGFMLNMKSKSKGMLHHVDCPHFGDTTWESSEAGNLSRHLKYCNSDSNFLQDWAEAHGIDVVFCSDCLDLNEESPVVVGDN
ncbi:MAG: hypothetical protein M9884_14930, partial [Rhodocyclaceae bacterium]|nr:hypothetical protein [Rhodocyclaceae bacterium]